MKKQIRVFNSFAEAEAAESAYYKSLTSEERMEMFLQMMAPYWNASPKIERVAKLIDRESGRVLCEIDERSSVTIQRMRSPKGSG